MVFISLSYELVLACILCSIFKILRCVRTSFKFSMYWVGRYLVRRLGF
jgi:hypothetical protein